MSNFATPKKAAAPKKAASRSAHAPHEITDAQRAAVRRQAKSRAANPAIKRRIAERVAEAKKPAGRTYYMSNGRRVYLGKKAK